jgi:uncharacterized damage-inducible protein DinB
MTEAQILSSRFTQVMLNGTWVANTNYYEALNGLPLSIANKKLGNHNTIAVLAQHINYYINGLNQVFAGGALTITDAQSFNFTPLTTQQQWDAFLTTFFANATTFANYVATMPDATLNEPFVRPEYGTYTNNINAAIEHAYYHLGQITLLKKLHV